MSGDGGVVSGGDGGGGSSTLRIGLVGHGFMGRMHSLAWQTVGRAVEVPLVPELIAIAGRNPGSVAKAARAWGWQSWTDDWRTLVARDDIDVIDITTPGALHAEIALAALAAGKHVLCEKPLANTLAEARADDGGGRGGGGARRAVHGRVQLPAHSGARAGAGSGGAGAARRDPACAGRVLAGLDQRSGVPAGVAAS